MVIFLLTRRHYRKKRELETPIRFNPNDNCIHENLFSELHDEKTSAGNIQVGVCAEAETYDNPCFSPDEKEVDNWD